MKVTDKITITNEDCMELLKRTPDKYYSLAICDPPYGIGFDKENTSMSSGERKDGSKRNMKTWSSPKKKGYASKNWDSSIPTKEYFEELKRVSKNYIIWGGNYMTEYLKPHGGWIVWEKGVPDGMSLSQAELAYNTCLNSINIVKVLWAGYKKAENEQRFHPTQKPVALYKWLLSKYANELVKCENCLGSGETESISLDCDVKTCQYCKGAGERKQRILDTHLGSGSIAIACHDLGFELTACELDSDYYNAAIKRIKKHVSQLSLFEPEELTQTNQTLF